MRGQITSRSKRGQPLSPSKVLEHLPGKHGRALPNLAASSGGVGLWGPPLTKGLTKSSTAPQPPRRAGAQPCSLEVHARQCCIGWAAAKGVSPWRLTVLDCAQARW